MELTENHDTSRSELHINARISDIELHNAFKAGQMKDYILQNIADRMVQEIWDTKRDQLVQLFSIDEAAKMAQTILRERMERAMNLEERL